MAYTFIATVDRQYVTIRQQIAGKLSEPVAYIQDEGCPADYRHTLIDFAGNTLEFEAAYDGPMRDCFVRPFEDRNHCKEPVLYDFPWINQSYLYSREGLYPVRCEWNDDDFKITVYQSAAVQQDSGLWYPVLATITRGRTYENGFEYIAQVEEKLPASTLMAILSLPFTGREA